MASVKITGTKRRLKELIPIKLHNIGMRKLPQTQSYLTSFKVAHDHFCLSQSLDNNKTQLLSSS